MFNLMISGDDNYLIIKIAPNIRVSISGLTFVQGYQYSSVGSLRYGGAIYNKGILTLDNVTITDSSIEAQTGYLAYGGAIYSTGGLTITNSHVYSNHADVDGGGIYVQFASCSPPTMTLTISNSLIYSNTAERYGGGIYANTDTCYPWTTTLKIANSVIYRNVITSTNTNFSPMGAGIYLYYTSARIADSTLSENHAGQAGGGISGQADWDQYVDNINCTITNNTAQVRGGGIYTPETVYKYHLKKYNCCRQQHKCSCPKCIW